MWASGERTGRPFLWCTAHGQVYMYMRTSVQQSTCGYFVSAPDNLETVKRFNNYISSSFLFWFFFTYFFFFFGRGRLPRGGGGGDVALLHFLGYDFSGRGRWGREGGGRKKRQDFFVYFFFLSRNRIFSIEFDRRAIKKK